MYESVKALAANLPVVIEFLELVVEDDATTAKMVMA